MSFSKFLNPKNDLTFRRIFGTEPNKDILIQFLNDTLDPQGDPIQEVTYLKTTQEPEIAAQRQSIVDILCQDVAGKRFIVEMQVAHEKGFEKRAQFYAAKAYIDQRGNNVDYADLKEVIFLAIMDFTMFNHKPGYICRHVMLDDKTHERDLKDFSFTFIELPKFTNTKEQLKTDLERWCYFFKHAEETREEDLPVIIGQNTMIERAYKALNRYAWTREELYTYDAIEMKISADKAILDQARESGFTEGKKEGEEKGRKEGEEKGRREGEEKKAYQIARALLEEGLPLELIQKATGLKPDKIIELQKDLTFF